MDVYINVCTYIHVYTKRRDETRKGNAGGDIYFLCNKALGVADPCILSVSLCFIHPVAEFITVL